MSHWEQDKQGSILTHVEKMGKHVRSLGSVRRTEFESRALPFTSHRTPPNCNLPEPQAPHL